MSKTSLDNVTRTSSLHNCVATVCLVIACAGGLSGCAAFSNPVANGIPVRMVPDELLADSRETYEKIDLSKLRRDPPEFYELGPGDTLGVYIEGVVGDITTTPPVNLPESLNLPPAIGYPFPIRSDGTISLPLVGSVQVANAAGGPRSDTPWTIEKAQQSVVDQFREREILRADDENPRIILTMMRPRTVRVLVVREDGKTPSVTISNQSLRGLGRTSTTLGGGSKSVGERLDLPVYQNDVLTALTATGGLPSNGIASQVVIYRDSGRTVTIPMRRVCGAECDISPDDITLRDGDILTVESETPQYFYTGGLLPGGEHQLPTDHDLTAIEALLRVQGPLVNGGINSSNLSGSIVGAGYGNPSPSQLTILRKLPNGQQANILVSLNEALNDPRQDIILQAEDILLLQETRDEALARYFWNDFFRFDLMLEALNRGSAQAVSQFSVP